MYIHYQGRPIAISRRANNEMVDCRIYMDDIVKILEEGRDLSRSKRKKGTLEKVMRIRGRTIKIVLLETVSCWNDEWVWLIIHVGDTSER